MLSEVNNFLNEQAHTQRVANSMLDSINFISALVIIMIFFCFVSSVYMMQPKQEEKKTQ